jgi:hypothetical protein
MALGLRWPVEVLEFVIAVGVTGSAFNGLDRGERPPARSTGASPAVRNGSENVIISLRVSPVPDCSVAAANARGFAGRGRGEDERDLGVPIEGDRLLRANSRDAVEPGEGGCNAFVVAGSGDGLSCVGLTS